MRVLVQIPYDWDNLKEVPNFIIDKIVGAKISAFTPAIFAEAFLYQGAHDFTARMLSIALTIEQDHELIPWMPTPVQLYIGPAPRNIKFDEIIIYKKDTLSTQEEYLKTSLYGTNYQEIFIDRIYSSSDASIAFDSLEKMTEYLMLLGSSLSA